jgi:hypothetical protein
MALLTILKERAKSPCAHMLSLVLDSYCSSITMAQSQHLESVAPPPERVEGEEPSVPRTGPERKRKMSEVIARIAEEDRELLLKLAR